MNMPDDASRILSPLVRKNPTEPAYLYHLGAAQFRKGDKAAARKDLEAALMNKPHTADERGIRELLAQTQ
jgi:cytochrome c-type biogenesis protein CcmH/NrfG